jgi:hypothetical protein
MTPMPHAVPRLGSPAPARASDQIQLPAMDDVSEPGARPLIDDPKLGWETSPLNQLQELQETSPQHEPPELHGLHQDPQGHPIGAQLASDGSEHVITSNAWWVALAIVVVLGVAAAVVLIATST